MNREMLIQTFDELEEAAEKHPEFYDIDRIIDMRKRCLVADNPDIILINESEDIYSAKIRFTDEELDVLRKNISAHMPISEEISILRSDKVSDEDKDKSRTRDDIYFLCNNDEQVIHVSKMHLPDGLLTPAITGVFRACYVILEMRCNENAKYFFNTVRQAEICYPNFVGSDEADDTEFNKFIDRLNRGLALNDIVPMDADKFYEERMKRTQYFHELRKKKDRKVNHGKNPNG